MRAFLVAFVAGLALVTLAPSGSACKLDEEFDQDFWDDLCAVAQDDLKLDLPFGEWADVALIVAGLILLPLVLSIIVWLIRKPTEGPKLGVEARETMREVTPGGTVQLIVDVENKRRDSSVDVSVDVGRLPEGWSAQAFASLSYPSEFTQPQALSADQPLHLSSGDRGAHRAALAVQLTAPAVVAMDETLELPVRIVPVSAGVRRTGRGRKVTFTVLLSSKRTAVQIANVTHDPEQLTAGQPVLTRAVVTNAGEMEAHEVGVGFFLNEQSVDRKLVPVLKPQEQATVEFQWIPGPGENRIRISVA